ncbi:MAG TPA: ATP-binding protein [Bryobacteraceae bacterium]|jgi:signal transduction histidine kinase/CheY-like chemotaxis protein
MTAWLKRIWRAPLSPLTRALLPVASIGLALLSQAILQWLLPKQNDFPYAFLYLIAIFAVAWRGGYWQGAASCLLTMVGIPWLLAPGPHLPKIDPSRFVLLLGVSLGVSGVAHAQRRMREALRQANEELDLRVQERTTDLEGAVTALKSEIELHKGTEERLQTQLERLNLLDELTRAIGERQDLASVYQVVIRRLEDNLPIDLGCVCLYDATAETLTVNRIGVRSEALALELAMTEEACIPIDQNGLSRCVQGQLVYEADVSKVAFPFPQRLYRGGLHAVVCAPLQVESRVFGVLIAARRQPESFSSGECEFIRQLSEHVALAAHHAQVYEALQRAYDDLRLTQQTVLQQERLRALGQMASGIAHDINNAVSPVSLYTDILLETEPNLSAQTRRYLETTQCAMADVAHTVARMREFYRQPEPQAIQTPVDLSQLAHQVLDFTRVRWSDMPQQRGLFIQLKTELPEGLPSVAGVESEIREALTNLVFNAVDAMPEGGTLTLRTRSISGPSTGSFVAVEVSDSGVGMSEETRRRCLEPFFTTKGERGTGLGLAMVYGIAQRHSAEIEIDSAPGKGATLRMLFPVLTSGQPGLEQDGSTNAIPSRLRVLVVDDDPLLIRSLRDALETDGHLITTANGGKEGIDAFHQALDRGEQFAIVITDLGMPYVDGRKVSSAIKAVSPLTPVVLLTGWGQRLIAEGDIPPHVDRVLNKPPRLRELRAALAELVASSDLTKLAREVPRNSTRQFSGSGD